jgi:hypothetical protein
MAVTEAQQIPDPFALDDDDDVSDPMVSDEEAMLPGLDVRDEAGTLGLHRGVLLRFAMLALGPPLCSSIRPSVDR